MQVWYNIQQTKETFDKNDDEFQNDNYQLDSLSELQNEDQLLSDPLVDYKWQQTKKKWIENNRYPTKNISKQRREYEMALFDFERQKIWKRNFISLFTNILRRQRRKEKLMKVVGFHRFIRNVALLSRVTQIHQFKINSFEEQNIASKASLRGRKAVTPNPKEQSKQPKNQTAQIKQLQVKQSPESKDKKLVDSQNSYNQAIKQISQKVQKLSAVGKMVKLYQRKELEDGSKMALAFAKWMRYNVEWENKALQEELASITFVLNERVFRESFLRTKLQLAKSEMDSKITLISELLFTILAKSK